MPSTLIASSCSRRESSFSTAAGCSRRKRASALLLDTYPRSMSADESAAAADMRCAPLYESVPKKLYRAGLIVRPLGLGVPPY
jgi:hypothetical protein